MGHNLIPFEFKGQPVRLVLRNGEPLWVVKDVCEVLGLGNPSEAIRRLDDDDLSSTDLIDSLGRTQSVKVVNESGLYTLILGSRKPEAKAFKRWVTHEVLPSIRQTGAYMTPKATQSPAQMLLLLAQQLVEQERRIVALEQRNAPQPGALSAPISVQPAAGVSTSDLPLLLKPVDAIATLDVGRNAFYELVRSGRLRSIRVGRLIRIPKQAIADFINGNSGR
jgi:anti-repressor protein